MGQFKKEKNRVSRDKAGGDDRAKNIRMKGENFYRDAKKIKYINMLKGGKAIRDSQGKIIQAADFQSTEVKTARIAPNRKWFGNTRVIGQKALEDFRESLGAKIHDPYQVLLKQNKLPMSLLQDPTKQGRMHILETESFSTTFGNKAQRKRPKLAIGSMEELMTKVDDTHESYQCSKDTSLLANKQSDFTEQARGWYLQAGQSKRIWNELYKVIDSSDVIIHVLDARDPEGTRCRKVENYIRKEKPHKHLIFVLNKVDLVPTWSTARWVATLSRDAPTLAFHASINNSFGKGSLIQLLRQFSGLHSDKKQISVGFIGYPNTGKSSIINTLKAKKVCNVAPIPGETKVWQYITLMKRIYLIDCPGVVPPNIEDSDTDIILKGSVRVENIPNPEDTIPTIMERVRREYVQRTYGLHDWADTNDFLEQLARKTGKLLKRGEPDLHNVSVMVLNDWLRGRIPYYVPPADAVEPKVDEETEDGRKKINVEQLFGKINVTSDFMEDDLANNAEVLSAEREKVAKLKEEAEAAKQKPTDKPSKVEEVTDWDEVFESVVGEEGPVVKAPVIEGEEEVEEEEEQQMDSELEMSEDEGEDEEEAPKKKRKSNEPVTENGFVVQDDAATQKKKKAGVHFYETANVKNRNRSKVKPDETAKKVMATRLKGSATAGKRKRR
ncbi:GTPase required for pre-60S ribosomal subunit nuclear export and maturation [Apophysomyces sp. BC1034]|nr:GTPase required for pre-60S ribosomal subunit nuclear export and maturation [Apophysomyces sp. BC1015]KAG0168703.1 GTPase required for pre-60S ribosomal subunit nuclear export and maturation [Apophysomyces sp. BC1021]KAG0184184.1 GTPase required for pre-60S ribosomal subunit nuclear export and maturation [Apophysomyces sp. BC1034]